MNMSSSKPGSRSAKAAIKFLVCEPGRGADRLHIEVIPGLASGVHRGQLAGDGVGQAQHWPHFEEDGVLPAPIHPEIDVDRSLTIRGQHVETGALRAAPGQFDSVACGAQIRGHSLNSIVKQMLVAPRGEQRSTSSVGLSVTPCSRIAPDPASAKPEGPIPAGASRAISR
jgi:hypothetical protein